MKKSVRALLSVLAFAGAGMAAAQSSSPYGPMVAEFGGATLINANWLTFRDYPVEAMASNTQGRVLMSFDIGANGRATNCVVKKSSGSLSLDRTPCRLLVYRARFRPATDESGAPKATTGVMSVDFWIPK